MTDKAEWLAGLPGTMTIGEIVVHRPSGIVVRLMARCGIGTHEREIKPGDKILRGDRLTLVTGESKARKAGQ